MVDFGEGKKPSQGEVRGGGSGSPEDGGSGPDDAGRSAGRGAARRRSGALAFDDVVGQAELKQALLAVATDDDLDGLLVRGEKGTAKSTLVRGLADLLPEQPVVADCPYGCHPEEAALQCADCRERSAPPIERRPVPLVTVPLGATRDRVVGTLSVADALDGDPEFQPGLLARAHRGYLYVDEVNLLDDHLVDVLLDAAASGVNRVERDGVSATHPTEFTLIGTMNPEEGELRPQLRDRFALQATVSGCTDLDRRVEIVERALQGGRDRSARGPEPAGDSGERLRRARRLLTDVELPESFAEQIAATCLDAGVDGHRGDIAVARAARTLAALEGRTAVIESDVRRAAELALPHRLRSRPFEEPVDLEDVLDEQFGDESRDPGDGEGEGADGDAGARADTDGDEASEEARGSDEGCSSADGSGDAAAAQGGPSDRSGTQPGRSDEQASDEPAEPDRDDAGGEAAGADAPDGDASAGSDRREGGALGAERGGSTDSDEDSTDGDRSAGSEAEDGAPAPIVPGQRRGEQSDDAPADATTQDAAQVGTESDLSVGEQLADGSRDADAPPGSHSGPASASADAGPRVRTEPATDGDRVDATASVRAAAARGADDVASRDLRAAVRRRDAAALVVFAVDASASMRPAMREAKGTVLELLRDAYQQRDEVAFVAFAGEDAEVLLPPTDSVEHAARHLKAIPTGDRTPLPDGLATAAEVVERADPAASVAVVVTDGRANVADGSPVEATRRAATRLGETASQVLLVDAGEGGRGSLTDLLAAEAEARRLPLDALTADRVDAELGAATDGD